MKSRIITGVLCILTIIFLFASLGHAQIAGSSVQPVNGPSYSMPDHPQHAGQGILRPEQNLFGNGSTTAATGERPMWEVARPTPEPSLGIVAREYREKHKNARSPRSYWEQQGTWAIRETK